MSDPLASRLDFLRATQNSDGGWGFFPRKQSWLEPTAYALMALHSDSSSRQNFERGWKLMRSWTMENESLDLQMFRMEGALETEYDNLQKHTRLTAAIEEKSKEPSFRTLARY